MCTGTRIMTRLKRSGPSLIDPCVSLLPLSLLGIMPRKTVLCLDEIPMSVDVGTRLGSLEITALLGKGGMGEVYRAYDTKLKRDVAVKILPDEFARDADRVSRFQREAEVLASLNHPNIAAIYDLQEANDVRFLVLELVEGETLADRLQRGPVPIEEALNISK